MDNDRFKYMNQQQPQHMPRQNNQSNPYYPQNQGQQQGRINYEHK